MMPVDDAFELETTKLQALLSGCVASLDESTASFALRRTFYVAIFVEAEAEDEVDALFDELLDQVRSAIGVQRASIAVEFGPFEGSRLQLIFASSDDYIVGQTFGQRLSALRAALKPFVSSTKKGVLIGLIVANGAITVVGGDEAAAEMFNIPLPVVQVVYQASNIASTVSGVKNVLFPPFDKWTPKTFKIQP